MLKLSLSSQSGVPLVDQITEAVRAQIDDRVLRPGIRLPAIRQLAEQHQISRFTVVEAYDRLVAKGYLLSRRGSGFYVAAPREPATLAAKQDMSQVTGAATMLRRALDAGAEGLRASAGWLPASWLDQEELSRQLRVMLRCPSVNLTDYGGPMGFAPLREYLPLRLSEFGIAAHPAQILLTQSATHGLDLIARAMVRANDVVLVDDPGYATLFGNLRLHGARLVGVPWTPEGPDTAALERLAATHKPRIYFTQPLLHNPTGASITPANAHRVLQCAERHDFMVAEDDIYCDFYEGTATRLATLDQLNRVIYIGSTAKTLSGNLRSGFIAACPDVISTLTDIKVLTMLSTSAMIEEVVYRSLTAGHYRKHVERLRSRLREAAGRCTRMLDRLGLQPFVPLQGGLFTWVRLPDIEDAAEVAAQAAAEQIILAPGSLYRPQNQASPYLRLSIVYANDIRLERFLKRVLRR